MTRSQGISLLVSQHSQLRVSAVRYRDHRLIIGHVFEVN